MRVIDIFFLSLSTVVSFQIPLGDTNSIHMDPFIAGNEDIHSRSSSIHNPAIVVTQGVTSTSLNSNNSPISFEDDANSDKYATIETQPLKLKEPREPLRFEFEGYTIWLELEEESHNYDFTKAIQQASRELQVQPIPHPHVTAIYGMTHFSSLEKILAKWEQVKECIKSWPELKPRGFISDVEIAGINGALMSMSWSEITYSNSAEHEDHLNVLYDIFYSNGDHPEQESAKQSSRSPWQPHLSLAYDNPEDTVLSLSYIASLVAKIPSLAKSRKVRHISLWNTYGKMSEWSLIDRYTLEK